MAEIAKQFGIHTGQDTAQVSNASYKSTVDFRLQLHILEVSAVMRVAGVITSCSVRALPLA